MEMGAKAVNDVLNNKYASHYIVFLFIMSARIFTKITTNSHNHTV